MESHILWPAFMKYAEENGIDLQYEEDWQAWWDCFLSGARAQLEQI